MIAQSKNTVQLLLRAAGAILLFVISGCGLAVPEIKEVWDRDFPPPTPDGAVFSGTAQIEFEIRSRVLCDLKRAVKAVNKFDLRGGDYGENKLIAKNLLPLDWGAQVSLSLTVDEAAAFNPGVLINQVMPNAIQAFGPADTVTSSQYFQLGLGGILSSTATRTDKFDPYYTIKFLMENDRPGSVCLPGGDPFRSKGLVPASSSPFITGSDLGIERWLLGAMLVNSLLPSQSLPKSGSPAGSGLGPFSISYEIKFVIVSSGNINPTYKLVSLTANSGSLPLLSTERTRTHDLIITIGPQNQNTVNAHFALQLGNAVATGRQITP